MYVSQLCRVALEPALRSATEDTDLLRSRLFSGFALWPFLQARRFTFVFPATAAAVALSLTQSEQSFSHPDGFTR